jgi:hemolysin activation/secretion protein
MYRKQAATVSGKPKQNKIGSEDDLIRSGGLKNRGLSGRAIIVSLLLACTTVDAAWADVTAAPPGTRPGETLPPLPEYKKPEKAPALELPPVKPPAEQVPFVLQVFVREFRITGNTAIPLEELKKIAAPYENRSITNADLEELRQRLTRLYIDRGYINSGAVIPDQKVVDGVVEIHIIEGRLTRIDVEGTKHFSPEYFVKRLERSAGTPLNVRTLEQALQILLQDPLIARINAQLTPGERPGEAVLKVEVAEASPYDFGLLVDNKLSPSLGEVRVVLQGEYRNLMGRGDVLSAELEGSEGIHSDLKLNYAVPVTAEDTAISFFYEKAKTEVVQEPFNVLDIRGDLETYGMAVSKPVYRTPARQLSLSASLERRQSDSSLLGESFSFSPGVQNGQSVVSVLRLVQDFANRQRNEVIAARSTFSFGLDAFGATINDTGPDGRFTAWLGQFQWAHRFGERGQQLLFRLEGQLSNNPLLPLEQYSVGGLDSVRGYRTNQIVRDQGYSSTLEYRLPIFRNPVDLRNLQFAAFIDTGGARNKEGPNPDPTSLTSVGIGLVWDPTPKMHAELYVADALDNVENPGNSIQDSGIFFRLAYHPLWAR